MVPLVRLKGNMPSGKCVLRCLFCFVLCSLPACERRQGTRVQEAPSIAGTRESGLGATEGTGRITLRPETTIDIDSGPGIVDETGSVAIDSLGRIWAAKIGYIAVYSNRGDFIARVGRLGSGPGEYRHIGPMITDSKGRVHIFDQILFRETIVDRDFKVHAERALPGPVNDAAFWGTADSLLTNAEFPDSSQSGYPLHFLDGTSRTKSFGAGRSPGYSVTSGRLQRQLAIAPGGLIVSAHRNTHVVEIYDRSGALIKSFELPHRWPALRNGDPVELTMERGPGGFVQDIAIGDDGKLLVLSWEPKANWRELVDPVRGPHGQTLFREKEGVMQSQNTRIMRVDLATMQIDADGTFDRALWGLFGSGKAFGFDYSDEGQPRLVIHTLQFSH
ncbi:hypothetical protein [Gemmatimonas sp.]|uniref:hypothetical protein n=1 Tax=Gemmatimonas sp. TaxID=1962908 RepID=UPI003F7035D1